MIRLPPSAEPMPTAEMMATFEPKGTLPAAGVEVAELDGAALAPRSRPAAVVARGLGTDHDPDRTGEDADVIRDGVENVGEATAAAPVAVLGRV